MKRRAAKRVYNKKAWKCRQWVYKIVLTIFFPIWIPLYLIVFLGNKIEDFLDLLDSLLDKFLDITIPRFGGLNNKKR